MKKYVPSLEISDYSNRFVKGKNGVCVLGHTALPSSIILNVLKQILQSKK
jgi:hypothetical protein